MIGKILRLATHGWAIDRSNSNTGVKTVGILDDVVIIVLGEKRKLCQDKI